MYEVSFSLTDIKAPFRLDLTAWALRRKSINEIDVWNGEAYSRVVELDQAPVLINVTQSDDPSSPGLHVQATSPKKIKNVKAKVTFCIRRVLGLDVDLAPFYTLAREDKRLNLLVGRFMGVRPPRFLSLFEGVVNGIACQQLSLHVGITLLNRLAGHCGLPAPDKAMHSFPTPEHLANFSVPQFRDLGFSTHKAEAIRSLASALLRGSFREDLVNVLSDDQARLQLEKLKGVGRWTAEYALLRGMGRLDVFPGDDVGGRNKLKKWLKLRKDLDYADVKKIVLRWKPYEGMVYFLLLLDSLEKDGNL